MRKKTFSTFEIAKMLELSPGAVSNWIDAGKITAFCTPGGHRRVKGEDLMSFLKKERIPFPEALKARMNKNKKVLIVEDDPVFLKLMTRAFTSFKKWEVLTAQNGFSAGALVGSEKPEVVILDIMLPDINGFKICEIIKAHNRNTIVVAVTGYDSEDVKLKILQAGADAYFVKPFKIQELLVKITAVTVQLGLD